MADPSAAAARQTPLGALFAERVGPVLDAPLRLGLSLPEVLEALFKGCDFTEPVVFPSFEKALFGVVGHLVDAAELCGVDAQEAAARAGFTELVKFVWRLPHI